MGTETRGNSSGPNHQAVLEPIAGRQTAATMSATGDRRAVRLCVLIMATATIWMAFLAAQQSATYSDPVERAAWPDMRINVNTATEAELSVLPGIGPRLAERIVADRTANGPFDSLDDLTRVRMIGPRTVERIAEYVIVEWPHRLADSAEPHPDQRETARVGR